MNSISGWVEDFFSKKAKIEMITAHVDLFLNGDSPKTKLVSDSLNLYYELVNHCINTNLICEYLPLLCIPLTSSENIKVSFEEDELFLDQIAEPPSLYLVQRKSSMFVEQIEEYKIYINSPIKIIDKNYFCYYRCFRNKDEIMNDFEYNRCIYWEYFPDKYIL